MRAADPVLALLARGLLGLSGALPWPAARTAGAALGEVLRGLGVRRRVAEENLRLAFPEWGEERRAAVLRAHYRELGRVALEYGQLGRLANRPAGEVFAAARGREHLEGLKGRGAILVSGHYSNFELLGSWAARINPLDFLVKPLSNPGAERLIRARRGAAGVGFISIAGGSRPILEALRAGRWVAFLADQDARRQGVFVPFLERPASTPVGPAVYALRTGAPLVTGFISRRADGRFEVDIDAPHFTTGTRTPGAVLELTALHVARLEARVRARPELWFWLHRRWKTRPPADPPGAAPEGGSGL